MAKRKRRLVRGRDWHAWAWKHKGDKQDRLNGFMFFAEANRDRLPPTESGRWVRVKFVEVK